MVEQQIDKKLLLPHPQAVLASNKRESPPKLDEELPQMSQQSLFKFALFRIRLKRDEVEYIRIFHNLIGGFRMTGRKQSAKVVRLFRVRLALKQLRFNLVRQHGPRPTIGYNCAKVILSFFLILHSRENGYINAPRQFSNES